MDNKGFLPLTAPISQTASVQTPATRGRREGKGRAGPSTRPNTDSKDPKLTGKQVSQDVDTQKSRRPRKAKPQSRVPDVVAKPVEDPAKDLESHVRSLILSHSIPSEKSPEAISLKKGLPLLANDSVSEPHMTNNEHGTHGQAVIGEDTSKSSRRGVLSNFTQGKDLVNVVDPRAKTVPEGTPRPSHGAPRGEARDVSVPERSELPRSQVLPKGSTVARQARHLVGRDNAAGSPGVPSQGSQRDRKLDPMPSNHHTQERTDPRHAWSSRPTPPFPHSRDAWNNNFQQSGWHQAPYAQRPPPRHRELFNPTALIPLHRDRPAHPQEQAAYLERMKVVELPNAEMSTFELNEKEALRKRLEQLFRDTISTFEAPNNASFRAETVQLNCFGSLSSGFATRDSDMDLMLISPTSLVDPISITSEIPRLLEGFLLREGYGARLLTRTRVPIIRFCEKPNPDLLELLRQERKKWEDEKTLPKGSEKTKKKKRQRKSLKKTATKDVSGVDKEVNAGEILQPVLDEDADDSEEGMNDESVDAVVDSENQSGSIESTGPENQSLKRPDEELVRLFELAMSEGWYGDADREVIHQFIDAFRGADGNVDDEKLGEARKLLKTLPDVLSRYREKPKTHLDFPKDTVGIQCDINFSNHLAMHNTKLLRCYCRCDPRVRQIVLFVKAWAKRRRINTPYKGTLSSYGYVLMVLHYLVNVAQPPVAPNLQLQLGLNRGGSPGSPKTYDGYDVRFWRNEAEIELAASRHQLTYNKESVGSLLVGFFRYFAVGSYGGRKGFMWTHEVLSLRTEGGLLTKEEKGWTGARTQLRQPDLPSTKAVEVRHRYLFAIEDPFELEHNVARPVTHYGIVAIRDEFRRANRIIMHLGVIDGLAVNLFDEGQDHDGPEPSFFGPHPERGRAEPKPSLSNLPQQRIVQGRRQPNGADEGPGKHVGLVGPGQQGHTDGDIKYDVKLGGRPLAQLQSLREKAEIPNEALVTAGLVR